HADAGFLHSGLEVLRRNLRLRRDIAQVETDARHDAFFERILIDRNAVRTEMPRRVDMRAAVIGHRDEHRCQPPDIAGGGKRIGMVLPYAVDDGRMSRVARGTVIELAAEVDDLHESLPGPTSRRSLAHDPEKWAPVFRIRSCAKAKARRRSSSRFSAASASAATAIFRERK